MQKFISIAVVVLKIFKKVKSTHSSRYLAQIKPDVNEVEGKNGRVYPINFCG